MPLEKSLHELARGYCRGKSLALLFDYDGTLTPIVAHPSLAGLPVETRRLLEKLLALPRVQIGIVSGRSLMDLKEMAALQNAIYAGSCGLELEAPGYSVVHPWVQRLKPVLDRAAASFAWAAARFPGAWVEDKPYSFTVHYRHVAHDRALQLRQRLWEVSTEFEGVLTFADCTQAWEVLPDLGWDKGEAVDLILAQYTEAPLVLYAGNDANDEPALDLVASRSGLSIGIGPHASPRARHHLEDPRALETALGELLCMLETSG